MDADCIDSTRSGRNLVQLCKMRHPALRDPVQVTVSIRTATLSRLQLSRLNREEAGPDQA